LARRLEFSVADTVKAACIVITMAYYSPKTSDGDGKYVGSRGKLTFSNLKVFRKADETFHFPNTDGYGTTDINEKINAKAFELILEIDNKGEKSGTFSTYEENGIKKKRGMVILTPNNGVIPD